MPYYSGTIEDDIINGSPDADTIFGSYGNDILYGFQGNDTFLLTHSNGNDYYIGGDGYDRIYVDHNSTAHFVIYSVIGIGSISGIEEIASDGVRPTHIGVINSADFTNTKLINIYEIQGSSSDNVITGSAQNDKIFGYEGNDTLIGGLGADTLTGGIGNDTYGVDNTGDVLVEDTNAGVDQVQSSISYTLGTNFENLTLIGTSSINGFGNGVDNTLRGNTAANVLSGGAGNDVLDGGVGVDTLVGGTGNDTYYVDNAGDIVTEEAAAGTDIVGSTIGHALAANVENLQLLGGASVNGIGNALNNAIIGNSGANTLGGNEGNDTVSGGADNDTVVGGPGNDYLQGDDGDDQVIGNDGIDQLFGGAGTDLLAGQGGNDQLTGGVGADQFYFNLNGGQDIITDFQNGTDKFVLGNDIKNISVLTHTDGSAVLDLYNAAASTPHTYVLLQGVQPSLIDGSDFLWAA